MNGHAKHGFQHGFNYAEDFSRVAGHRNVRLILKGEKTETMAGILSWHGRSYARNYVKGIAAFVIGEGC